MHACRYFSGNDLRELFTVSEQGLDASETAAQLEEMHGSDRQYHAALQEHLTALSKIKYFQATSDHSLLYKQDGAGAQQAGSEQGAAAANQPFGSNSAAQAGPAPQHRALGVP